MLPLIKLTFIKMKFKNWFEQRDREIAAAVAVVHQDRVLILHRGPTAPWMPNKWNFPGGIVEPDESSMNAAMRECQEEAGISPKSIRLLRHFRTPNYDVDIFMGKSDTNNVKIDCGSQNYAWITHQEVNNYDYVPFIKESLEMVFGFL